MYMRCASISMAHLLFPIIAGGWTGYGTETSDWLKPKSTTNSSALQSTVGEQNPRQNAESQISARGPNAEGRSGIVRGQVLPIFFHFQPEFAVRRKGGKLFLVWNELAPFWRKRCACVAAGAPESVAQFASASTWLRNCANKAIVTNFLPSIMCAVVIVGHCGIIAEAQVSARRANVAAWRSAPVWRQLGGNRAQEFGMPDGP